MQIIRPVNLAGIDLNLVKVLHALLEERGVTAAGRRVGLSQPATSNALRRLRDLLGDELLVRGAAGLELTAYARELQAPVREAVEALGRAFRPPARFEPGTARLTCRLAASDLSALAVLPTLRRILALEAPGIDLIVRAGEWAQMLAWLDEDAVDLAIGVFRDPPPQLDGEDLFTERYVLVLRAGHPLLEGELTAARLAAHPAVLVSPRGEAHGIGDEAMARLGLERRVAVTVAHFLLAAFLVRDGELTLFFPERLARLVAPPLGLVVLPPPLDLPSFTSRMLWSRRHDRDPPSLWLRDAVRRAVAAQADCSR
jgi:DNA-binding transcriptional LysR family regulator